MELTKASEENGFTMPEVPIMEMPPSIPRRGLKVRLAISSPPGDGDGNENRIGLFGNMEAFKP